MMKYILTVSMLFSPFICQAQDQNPQPTAQAPASVPIPPPNPKVEQALLDSVAKLKAGDSAGALQSVNEALRIDPYIPQAYTQRAIIHLDMKDWPGAIADATQSMKLGIKMEVAYNVRARAYIQNGMDQQAIDDVKEALKLDPNNAEAYFNSAQAKEALNYSPDDFLSDYKNAALLDPSFEEQSDAAFARFPGKHNLVTLNIPERKRGINNTMLIAGAVFILLIVLAGREQLAKMRARKTPMAKPPEPTA